MLSSNGPTPVSAGRLAGKVELAVESTDLTTVSSGDGKKSKVPTFSAVPLVYTHLFLTGDLKQHRQWVDRLEKIEQAEAVACESDWKRKGILSRPAAWKKIRMLSKWATNYGLVFAAMWTGWLVWGYAVALQFGWLKAAMYLLPLPLAWSVGRGLFQSNIASSMEALGPSPTLGQRAKETARSTARSFGAGFTAAFTLVFLQGLISWFMTPAPTIALELWLDFVDALQAALYGGVAASLMGPLLCVKLPSAAPLLDEGESAATMSLPESRS